MDYANPGALKNALFPLEFSDQNGFGSVSRFWPRSEYRFHLPPLTAIRFGVSPVCSDLEVYVVRTWRADDSTERLFKQRPRPLYVDTFATSVYGGHAALRSALIQATQVQSRSITARAIDPISRVEGSSTYLHTAHEKDFRKGNFVALKRHRTELYGTLYHNLLMFVAKQTSPDG